MERGLDLFFRPKRSEPEDYLFPSGIHHTALPDGTVKVYQSINAAQTVIDCKSTVADWNKVKIYNQI